MAAFRGARRTARRFGRFLLRGFASLAAMFGVLPADSLKAASENWLGPEPGARPEGVLGQDRPPPGARGRSLPDIPVWWPDRGAPPDSLVLPLDGPPPAHPERLVSEVPPSPGEQELWAQLEGPFPGPH
ncbi:DUF6059 family protein [Streptomyces sp. CAU 1734]|uniref:DUF6059 family protein n=1 Tax=Streptomyces sp. CAU 1734 TaxID=3140360 RepID=UPI003261C70B